MTPSGFSEQALVEEPTLGLLKQLGFEAVSAHAEQFGHDAIAKGAPGRDDRSEVVLHHRLRPKLMLLNSRLPAVAIELAIDELQRDRAAMDPVRASREVWRLIRDGAKVSFTGDDGVRTNETVKFVDWIDHTRNDFLAVSQFWVVGPLHTRRCDIVCFVNGIPLASVRQ